LTEKTTTLDVENRLLKYGAAHLSYGGLGVGAIDALLLYLHETDDDDSTPLLFVDNRFRVIASAPAAEGDETIYVDPIPDRLVSGTTLSFPAATIATLGATAEAGARQLQVQPLTGAVALAAEALSPVMEFPIPTNGGPLTISLPADLLEVAAL